MTWRDADEPTVVFRRDTPLARSTGPTADSDGATPAPDADTELASAALEALRWLARTHDPPLVTPRVPRDVARVAAAVAATREQLGGCVRELDNVRSGEIQRFRARWCARPKPRRDATATGRRRLGREIRDLALHAHAVTVGLFSSAAALIAPFAEPRGDPSSGDAGWLARLAAPLVTLVRRYRHARALRALARDPTRLRAALLGPAFTRAYRTVLHMRAAERDRPIVR